MFFLFKWLFYLVSLTHLDDATNAKAAYEHSLSIDR